MNLKWVSRVISSEKLKQQINTPPELITEQNRTKLKRVFCAQSSGGKMSFQDFLKFCRSSSIIPVLNLFIYSI